MSRDWRNRPDLVGFQVIALPSIEERIRIPSYTDDLSIPRISFDAIFGNGPTFDRKIKVSRGGDLKWHLNVPEIIESEFGGSFDTFESAWEYLNLLLEEKEDYYEH